jgi:HPt (histidine-containing phosphotransfer) domain-containing protein
LAPESDPAHPDFDAQFAALQRVFVAGLPARMLEISQAKDLDSLQAALHRLAGVAGSFGFAEMGHLASAAQVLSQASNDREDAIVRLLICMQDSLAALKQQTLQTRE